MMGTCLAAVPLLVGLFLTASPCLAHDSDDPAGGLTYLTEEFRPLNYTENGRPTGLAVALLKLLWQEMRVPGQPIHVMPWARIYSAVQLDPHTVIFSIYRTEEREKSFKWVGPITEGKMGLFALRSRQLTVRSLRDLDGRRIVSLRNVASATRILQAGLDLTYASRAEHAVQLLQSGRVDAVAMDEMRFRTTITAMGLTPMTFETVWILGEDALYYAFSLDTADTLINRFQQALDTVIQRPVYRNLLNFYIN